MSAWPFRTCAAARRFAAPRADAFRPSPYLDAPRASLAVRALCAETDAEARRLSASFGLMRLRMEQQSVLRQISETSGGQVYFPSSAKELDKVYAQVAVEIRSRYTLGYVSSNERTDGAWRKIEIKITRPDAKDLRVRARRGYYGPFKTP